MTDKATHKRTRTELLEKGYSIQFTLSLGSCKCCIWHSSWLTDNVYASAALPTGKGETEAEALREALKDWLCPTQEDNHAINSIAEG